MRLAPERRAALHAALAADPEWQALLRHFDLSHGFSFLVLLVESRENAELCRENLAAHLNEKNEGRIERIPINSPDDFLDLPNILRHPELRPDTAAIWVEAVATEGDPQFDSWRRAWRGCFAHLNPIRNIMQREIPYAVIFVGAPWVQAAIRESAPDLWSIRTTVTRVAPQAEAGLITELPRVDERAGAQSENAPDPEYALKMAEGLRGKAGQELEMSRLLQRAAEGFLARNEATRAIEALKEAESLQIAASAPPIDISNVKTLLGRAYFGQANWAEADASCRAALELDQSIFGDESLVVAGDLNELANVLRYENRLKEAEALLRRALAIRERVNGPNGPLVAVTLNDLSLLLLNTGRLQEAEQVIRRAISIDELTIGSDHPRYATHLSKLAQVLMLTGRNSEAESLFRRAIEIRERAFGPDDASVAVDLVNLGLLLKRTNRDTEAEQFYRRALAIDEKTYGPDHPEVATDLNNLAELLADLSQYDEAEQMYRRALAIDERTFGRWHPNVANRLNNFALLLHETHRDEEAEPLAWRALRIRKQFERESGFKHPDFEVGTYESIARSLDWPEDRIEERLRSLDDSLVPET